MITFNNVFEEFIGCDITRRRLTARELEKRHQKAEEGSFIVNVVTTNKSTKAYKVIKFNHEWVLLYQISNKSIEEMYEN